MELMLFRENIDLANGVFLSLVVTKNHKGRPKKSE
jgi:hypothetical protein